MLSRGQLSMSGILRQTLPVSPVMSYIQRFYTALQIPKTMVKGFIGYINNPNTVFQFSNS